MNKRQNEASISSIRRPKGLPAAKHALAVGAAVGMLLLGATPAVADENASDRIALEEWLESYGVNGDTINLLVLKAEDGQPFDSMVAGEPVMDEFSGSNDEGSYVVQTFGDGSIQVTSLEVPDTPPLGVVAPFSITGCGGGSTAGVVTYTNCKVSLSNGMIGMSFQANYSRYPTGAQISSAWGQQAAGKYGTATYPTLGISRANQSGSLPALATSHSRWTSQAGTSSEDLYLSLRVTSSSAWTTDY